MSVAGEWSVTPVNRRALGLVLGTSCGVHVGRYQVFSINVRLPDKEINTNH